MRLMQSAVRTEAPTRAERTLDEHERIIVALASRDRSRCASEMVHHRYSQEAGLPIELPGAEVDIS